MKFLTRIMLGRLICLLPVFMLLAGVSHAQVDIDFNNYTIESYGGSGQDKNPTVTIEDQGATLRIVGNGWKKISLPYTVTANTVIEFDFQSAAQGEVHGIGLDTDNGISGGRTFKLYGTQNWGISAFDNYAGSQPNVKSYVIPAGQHFTGDMLYLTFTNDHDVGSPTAESIFSNVKIYENTGVSNINFNNYTIESYGGSGQDKNPTVTVEDQGATLRIVGNGWKKISLPYTVTANTVIEFDFQSAAQGEVHGIGLDTDNGISGGRTFKLYGTQNWGISAFDNYAGTQPDVKSYVIPAGQHFTGDMLYLTFTNDHDVGSPTAESVFSNVKIYESTGGGGTKVSGEITADTTWTLANSPYIVTGNISLQSPATLTIEPGVEVKFDGFYGMSVQGVLLAEGEENNKIIFTSNSSTPEIGDWYRIHFYGSSNGSIIRHAVIEYANEGIYTDSASPTIDNNIIHQNNTGIYLRFTNGSLITENTITNNVSYGIFITGSSISPTPQINNNSIYNNGFRNITVHRGNSNAVIDATLNWWGTTNLTEIVANISDRLDSSSAARLDISTILDAPGGNPIQLPSLVGAQISNDTTWTLANSPYVVVNTIVVNPGVRLTIEPGVQVKFNGDYYFSVSGKLDAQGTADNMIRFTSNQATPQPGDWGYINFTSSEESILRYTFIEYAEAGILLSQGETIIENNVVQNNIKGLYILGTDLPVIKNNTIANNTQYGIEVSSNTRPALSFNFNSLYNNGLYSFYSGASNESLTVNAKNNWWGTTDISAISDGIYDSQEGISLATVAFIPYLDGPNGNPIGGGGPVSGNLTTNTIWSKLASPIIVTGDTFVDSGVALTIEDGVEVRFDGNAKLEVNGLLNILGTKERYIKFTSNQPVPAPGDWSGLRLNNAFGVWQYFQVEYAENGVSIAPGLEMTFQKSTFTNNQDAMVIECTPTQGCPITLTDNVFENNTNMNLRTDALGTNVESITVNAENNWWGTVDAGEVKSKIFDNEDNANNPVVDSFPYLNGPDGQGVGGGFARGNITSDTTWTLEASPVNIIESVTVDNGITLTIEPGVEVRFNGNYYLIAFGGKILAEGTESARIKFTSNKSSPAAMDWADIVLGNGSVIRYATIEYGSNGLSVSASPLIENSIIQHNNNGVDLSSSTAVLNNNIVLNNLNYGVFLTHGAVPTITNNKIIRNDKGIHIFTRSSNPANPVINNNFIAENISYNLYIVNVDDTSTQIINAENNWWGSALASDIEASIYDNQDDLLLPVVDYEPFKEESDIIQVTDVLIEPFNVQVPLVGTMLIKYTIDKDADVTVKIYDFKNDQLVRTLLSNQARTSGLHSESWDGKDDFGQNLYGSHYFSISARDASSGQIGEYNPLFVTGPVDIINGSVTASFNPYKGEQATFSYDLVVPAVIRLRVGIPGDWESKKTFAESFRGISNIGFWDGRDDNGDIVVGASNYAIYGLANLVPDNFIFFSTDSGIKIDTINANPYGIYPLYREYTTITYAISVAATVTVEIVNPSGVIVKTLVNSQAKGGGSHTVVWDGTGNNGGIITDQGAYVIRVTAVDGSGNTISRDGYIRVF